ncbi:MAG: DotG/IcmE/VirB10 family type IV secretion system protein [Candidatus Eutrophobiaceae bacterium]
MSSEVEQGAGIRRVWFPVGILAMLSLMAIGMLFFSNGEDASVRISSSPQIKATPAGNKENEAYRKLLHRQNELDWQVAREQGSAAIPTLYGMEDYPVEEAADASVAVTEVPGMIEFPDNTPLPMPVAAVDSSPALLEELRGVLESWKPVAHRLEIVHIAKRSAPPVAARPNKVAASFPCLIPAGTHLYASMEMGANSDYPSVASAIVLGGKWDGGRLMGRFERREDRLVLTFDRLAMPDGQFLQDMQAIAIEPNDQIAALQGEVDYHVMHNYILPAAARFVSGWGRAATNSGSSVVHGPLGNSIVVNREFSANDELKAAAAETAAGVLQDIGGSRKLPTVNVKAGKRFTALFLKNACGEG